MPADNHKDFTFNPDDLDEDVELPLETKKEILHLHGNLAKVDYWQLLGIPWNAPVEAARTAYIDKVKVFHPDRYAGRKLGSYLSRIEKIFTALTEARDTLALEQRRQAYAKKTAPPEEFARLEMRKLQDEERAQERKARLARGNHIVAHATRVNDLFRRGQKAFDEGKFSQASTDFMMVLSLDSRHVDARRMVDQSKKRAAIEKAKELFEQGVKAEAVGNRAAARELLQQAAEADTHNPKYAIAASRSAREAGDLPTALTLAEQATRAAPRDGKAFEALGAVLQTQGNNKEAKRALERAVELDPDLDGAKAMLKKLRWSLFG